MLRIPVQARKLGDEKNKSGLFRPRFGGRSVEPLGSLLGFISSVILSPPLK
jgi:hypothetical protein